MKFNQYRVAWEVDVFETSPFAAAQSALRMQRNPESTAVVFNVCLVDESTGRILFRDAETIDLLTAEETDHA